MTRRLLRHRVVVVGDSVAGLAAAGALCRAGVPVDLLSAGGFSLGRAEAACGGIGVGDGWPCRGPRRAEAPSAALRESLLVGDFLASQPAVRAMIEAAPAIVAALERMGVPFHRDGYGALELRQLCGCAQRGAAFAGAATGPLVLGALGAQARRYEAEPATDARGAVVPGEMVLRRFEPWDFVRLVLDDGGACVGCVAQDLRSMALRYFVADAVVLAGDGPSLLYAEAGGGPACRESALGAAYEQGAIFANAELIDVHATAVAGPDGPLVLPEALRAEGARLWVPRCAGESRAPADIPEPDRDYLLERLYPAWGNLVPDDIAAREIWRAGEGRSQSGPGPGGDDGRGAYLDLARVDAGPGSARLAGALAPGRPLAGREAGVPIEVVPAMGDCLGGLWIDFEADGDGTLVAGSARNHATSIAGLYAVGAAACQYHGAGRLGGNALLAALHGASLAAAAVVAHGEARVRSAADLPRSMFERAEQEEREGFQKILDAGQDEPEPESAFALQRELVAAMRRDCGLVRDNARLDELQALLGELRGRARRIRCRDRSQRLNREAPFVRQLGNLLVLARVVVESARHRNESRGVHFKPAFPERDDARFLRATLARHAGEGRVEILGDVGSGGTGAQPLVRPGRRTYGRTRPLAPETPAAEAGGEPTATQAVTGQAEQEP
ncbi:MAG: FAD-binding protein [Deltaproteobacteria bacterium]|nr:FAD-binding protein [Deltaproteobacteria bacterium]